MQTALSAACHNVTLQAAGLHLGAPCMSHGALNTLLKPRWSIARVAAQTARPSCGAAHAPAPQGDTALPLFGAGPPEKAYMNTR